MTDSAFFTYVPLIGDDNIVDVIDNASGAVRKGLIALNASEHPLYITKNSKGDEGNLLNGAGTISSYTSKTPVGRRGNMISHLEIIGEGVVGTETSNILMFTRIPAGLDGLLGPEFSLSKQPPAQSFDYSKWLPRTEAKGCLSFYGNVQGSTSGLNPNTGRFPTTPSLAPFISGDACPLLYVPPGFYGNINTILNGLAVGFGTLGAFDLSIDSEALFGILIVLASFDAGVATEGSGKIVVDYSHSGSN